MVSCVFYRIHFYCMSSETPSDEAAAGANLISIVYLRHRHHNIINIITALCIILY
jgi:hypothetical protein